MEGALGCAVHRSGWAALGTPFSILPQLRPARRQKTWTSVVFGQLPCELQWPGEVWEHTSHCGSSACRTAPGQSWPFRGQDWWQGDIICREPLAANPSSGRKESPRPVTLLGTPGLDPAPTSAASCRSIFLSPGAGCSVLAFGEG